MVITYERIDRYGDGSSVFTSISQQNGVNGSIKPEQRMERHLELQKKISQAELPSPNRSNLGLPTSLVESTTPDSVSGSISPLQVTPSYKDSDDIFSQVSLLAVNLL